MRTVPARLVALLMGGGVLIAAPAVAIGSSGGDARQGAQTRSLADALASNPIERPWVDPDTVRTAVPADRYAPAGGCYAVRSLATGHYLARRGDSFAATGTTKAAAEPFHFQAYDLGKYLLFGKNSDFLAANRGQNGVWPAANDTAAIPPGYVKGTSDETLDPVRDPVADAEGSAATSASHAAEDAIAGGRIVVAAKPSGAAEWVVQSAPDGGFTLQLPVDDHDIADPGPLSPPIDGTLSATSDGTLGIVDGRHDDAPARFALEETSGCATWPEIGTQITGPQPKGATPYAETTGYLDAHLHGMAFEFLGGKARCGRPWHPYGVTFALVDCPDHGPGGYGAALEDVVSGHQPGTGHDTVGWPTFGYWPHYDSLTHEQVYYTWLERAWRGGLRMYTNLLVDNGQLCEIYPLKKNSCNEMDGVRLQAKRLHQFVNFIDAQSGGPGKGWLQIVTDPFQARRVINAGKLAVVMGIEVSVPFDCGEYLGAPRCTADEITSRLDEVYALGVRQMELTNKFDNALTGVTGDDGSTGVVVNVGNRGETGHFWKMQTCESPFGEATNAYDKAQYDLADETGTQDQAGRDSIFGAVLQLFGGTGVAPVYPQGPHCNALGLTDLGRQALSGMMKRGMLFDPDHMSALARHESLDYVSAAGYSGVVSSHSWADDPTYRRILQMGGVVTPHAGSSVSFVSAWQKLRTWQDPRYLFGVGYGSDVNGFSKQGSPRNAVEANDVDYPFIGLGGVRIDKQVSGKRTYDVNVDGVDHYGLYPDWVKDGTLAAGVDGPQFARDVQRGVEAYLQMWERAIGIAPNACRSDVPDLTARNVKTVKRGMTTGQVLATLGQPDRRQGKTFSYCSTAGRTTVTFNAAGRVA